MARERHLSSREFDNSQRLYIAVKSKQSACLQFIRTAMVRGSWMMICSQSSDYCAMQPKQRSLYNDGLTQRLAGAVPSDH